MSTTIGIDIGTSGVKAVVLRGDRIEAEARRPIAVSVPHPGWSEQAPDLWTRAVFACLDELAETGATGDVAGIGLSGQMLGAVCLDAESRPVRPAILWNDQRAAAECAELGRKVPDIGRRTNGAPDPGITAPKLLWLARHEPEAFARASMLVLAKDYVRLALTGELASEPTDAGGTQLFDVASGAWDAALCEAACWDVAALPPITCSWAAAGEVTGSLARRWGLAGPVPVAAGAGDNMACTLGVGAARPGDGVVTLGTSGVACLVDGRFHPAPEAAVLTSAHAAPDSYLSMGVVMSATASLDWLAGITGAEAGDLVAAAEALWRDGKAGDAPAFLPALTGIRTPLGRPDATGALAGLRPSTDRGMLAWALMEGVAFQVADCIEAQTGAGVPLDRLAAVGGGARSALWVRMIASLLDRSVALPPNGHHAAALGAGRLARVAAGQEAASDLAAPMSADRPQIDPDPAMAQLLSERRAQFDALLPQDRGQRDASGTAGKWPQ